MTVKRMKKNDDNVLFKNTPNSKIHDEVNQFFNIHFIFLWKECKMFYT